LSTRIVEVLVSRLDFKLGSPSVVAYESTEIAPNVIVSIELENGLVGWGNAAPDEHVTGENAEGVERTLSKTFRSFLIGVDALRIGLIWSKLNEIAPQQPAAIAAIDIALYDLLGKSANLPLHRLLGDTRETIETSVTLSIEETAVNLTRAREFQTRGFKALKIKCGLSVEGDIERIRAIRAAVGPEMRISLDANQGYDVDQTLRLVSALSDCHIAFIEQPIAANDLDGLRSLCSSLPIPVMADESVLSARDVLVTPAPLVNLKLMKTGGITGALRANAVADSRGIRTMIGCMDESMISMAAAAHLALALDNIAYADLDGHLDIIDDVACDGMIIKNGMVEVSERAGLGVVVDSRVFGSMSEREE
jgi:L-alanine-DL-glutamate epimerase-like enolase superfamily enzyme